jgi:hypothetical protein
MSLAIMLLYYALTACCAAVLVVNFVRTRDLQKAILYLVVLVPFVMRLARLK